MKIAATQTSTVTIASVVTALGNSNCHFRALEAVRHSWLARADSSHVATRETRTTLRTVNHNSVEL